MKVAISAIDCAGCGICADLSPEVFVMDHDNHVARVIVDVVPEKAETTCATAVKDCPAEAISIVE